MLKKLRVFASMLRLGTFTVARLALESEVSESTVHTVLGRLPEEWFERTTLRDGQRGGQPQQYGLTEQGRAEIEKYFRRLPAAESVTPAPGKLDAPVGLLAARSAVQQIESSDRGLLEQLRTEALHGLDWAEAELTEGAFEAGAATLKAEISKLRAELRQVSLEAERPEACRRKLEMLEWVTARIRQLFDARQDLAATKIFVGYLGQSPRAREMACFANGALSNELRGRGRRWSIEEPIEAHALLKAYSSTSQPARFVICVGDPPKNSTDLQGVLQKVTELDVEKACVLDIGNNPLVASVTKKLQMDYSPNALSPERLDWVKSAVG